MRISDWSSDVCSSDLHQAGVALWSLHHTRTHRMSTPPWPGRRHEAPVMNMRERFAALRNLPPFLRDIWRTSPSLALSSLMLRLPRALPTACLPATPSCTDDRQCALGGKGGAVRGD